MANQLFKIYQDLQAQAFDLRALLRLASWGCAAAAALMVAVFAAYSTARLQAQTVAAEADGGARSPMLAITAELAARAADLEKEARRLSEAVAALTADREELKTRIGSLERGLDEVTGSVKRQAAAPAGPASPQLPAIAFAPTPIAGGTMRRSQPEAEVAAPPPAAEPKQQPARVANTTPVPATPVAATPVAAMPAPAMPVAVTPAAATPAANAPDDEQTKGEFAVDVGGAVNFDGLRVLWSSSRNANAVLFESLQPLVAVRESRSRGVDLRLIVGPLASTEAATRMCAALLAARRSCQMTTYEGQPLPLAAPPDADRPPEKQAERRASTSSRNSEKSKSRARP